MIAISVTGKKTRDLMDIRFARCSHFVLINDKGTLTVDNPFSKNKEDVATEVINWLQQLGVTKIITGEVGPKAQRILQEKKMQIILMDAEKISVQGLRKKLNI